MPATQVWDVGPWDLNDDLAKIEQQWGYLQDILDDVALFDLRDADTSGWSCGEHVGHIALVAQWVASGIEQNLAEPDRNVDGEQPAQTAVVLEQGDFPRGVAEAPLAVNTSGKPRETFVPILPAAREAWARVSARATELPGCPARFPHFGFGYMTSTEWVRFCALHTAHHLSVVRDIRQARA